MRRVEPLSDGSATTLSIELGSSLGLAALVATWHGVILVVLLMAWGWIAAAPLWLPLLLVGSAIYLHTCWLVPGRGPVPRGIRISAVGEWQLDDDIGYLQSALVTPWLCRVVISRSHGGKRTIWLARDAMGDTAYWRLRRHLVAATSP